MHFIRRSPYPPARPGRAGGRDQQTLATRGDFVGRYWDGVLALEPVGCDPLATGCLDFTLPPLHDGRQPNNRFGGSFETRHNRVEIGVQ